MIQNLFAPYCLEDPYLQKHIDNFCFDNYALYPVENRDIFYVDEIFDLIKTHYIKKGLVWENNIHQLLKLYAKPGTVAIDIGGHMGIYTLNLSRLVGESGTVHVFEPQVKMFTELLINMSLNKCNNIIFHRRALGDEEKWVEMFSPLQGNEGMAYVKDIQDSSSTEKVRMQRLDDFHLDKVSFMKIDVEGYEMEVIKGGKETIMRNKPVMIIEIWQGPENHERIKEIEKLGYVSAHLEGDDYLFLPI